MTILHEITIGEIINAGILITTAFVVWLYTRAAQKSNEIQERPVLNLYFREDETSTSEQVRGKIRIRNVGNTPAYNVQFFGIEIGGFVYYPYFREPNPILEGSGDEKTIDLWVKTPTSGTEFYDKTLGFHLFLLRIFSKKAIKQNKYEDYARSALVFPIIYQNVNGKNFYSVFRIYSKIEPVIEVYDLVVEWIKNGQGEIDMNTAREICKEKPIMKKNER